MLSRFLCPRAPCVGQACLHPKSIALRLKHGLGDAPNDGGKRHIFAKIDPSDGAPRPKHYPIPIGYRWRSNIIFVRYTELTGSFLGLSFPFPPSSGFVMEVRRRLKRSASSQKMNGCNITFSNVWYPTIFPQVINDMAIPAFHGFEAVFSQGAAGNGHVSHGRYHFLTLFPW